MRADFMCFCHVNLTSRSSNTGSGGHRERLQREAVCTHNQTFHLLLLLLLFYSLTVDMGADILKWPGMINEDMSSTLMIAKKMYTKTHNNNILYHPLMKQIQRMIFNPHPSYIISRQLRGRAQRLFSSLCRFVSLRPLCDSSLEESTHTHTCTHTPVRVNHISMVSSGVSFLSVQGPQ